MDCINEFWKPIENTSYYMVSNLGRIKSLTRRIAHKDYFRVINERIMSLSSDKTGYKKTILRLEEGPKTVLVHRMVANAFLPNLKNLPNVIHLDGNRLNNHVNNLKWTTVCETNKSSTRCKGVTRYNARFTEEQIIDIINRLKIGMKAPSIAKDYKVSKSLIYNIKNGITWSHFTKIKE